MSVTEPESLELVRGSVSVIGCLVSLFSFRVGNPFLVVGGCWFFDLGREIKKTSPMFIAEEGTSLVANSDNMVENR